MDYPCPFCVRIARGEYDAIHSDSDVVVFAPLEPVTQGHMLVVSVRHIHDAGSDPFTAGKVMERAASIARNLACGSYNIITSAGEPATQTVRHLHLHIVPRVTGDMLQLPWSGRQALQP